MSTLPALFFKAKLRKVVFFVHLWFGLIVGLYFAILGVTGSILVFKPDLEATQLMPERRFVAPPSPDAPLMPLSKIIEGLSRKFPDARPAELGFVNPPPVAGGAHLMRLTQGKTALPTTINPYTGEVIKRYDHSDTWLGWIDDLHVNLLFQASGKVANGYGGLLAGLLLITGIWLWWPATVKQIKIRSTIKKGAGAQRVIADLHNVLGIYPFLLLLLVTLTGSVIVFYKPIQTVVMSVFGSPRTPRVPLINPAADARRLPIETLMDISEKIAPGGHFVFVVYPTAKKQNFYAYRRADVGIWPDTRIYLDPYNGKVLQVEREKTDPATRRIMRSASTIHFGRWGYLGSKILYFVLGFIPLGLFVTGVLMYIRSKRSKMASQARRKSKLAASSVVESSS